MFSVQSASMIVSWCLWSILIERSIDLSELFLDGIIIPVRKITLCSLIVQVRVVMGRTVVCRSD